MRGIAAISLRVYSACGVRNSVSEGANSCAWEVLAFGGATTDFTLAAFDPSDFPQVLSGCFGQHARPALTRVTGLTFFLSGFGVLIF